MLQDYSFNFIGFVKSSVSLMREVNTKTIYLFFPKLSLLIKTYCMISLVDSSRFNGKFGTRVSVKDFKFSEKNLITKNFQLSPLVYFLTVRTKSGLELREEVGRNRVFFRLKFLLPASVVMLYRHLNWFIWFN